MSGMTIKQLADVLGVSKTAIRKYLTEEFRANYVETTANGVITISETGCTRIAESMGKHENVARNTANEFAKTTENPRVCTQDQTLEAVIAMLQKDLEAKNAQLEAKDRQIEQLTSALEHTTSSLQAAQALHAGTMQHQLEAPGKKPGIFARIFGKNKE